VQIEVHQASSRAAEKQKEEKEGGMPFYKYFTPTGFPHSHKKRLCKPSENVGNDKRSPVAQ